MKIFNNKLAKRITDNQAALRKCTERLFAPDAVLADVKKAIADINRTIAHDTLTLAAHGYAMDGTRVVSNQTISQVDCNREIVLHKVACACAATRNILQEDPKIAAILKSFEVPA